MESSQKINKTSTFKSMDEFIILEEIGKGGYSKVYLVAHKETNRQYALKAAFKKKNGKDRSERTLTEIQVLKNLKHPNVIRLKGHFQDENTIYLVLEYISGKDCSKFFKNKLPSKSQIKSILKQLVNAVIYIHKQGIIHRDIKLENILIDKNLQIKLTDFGLCAIKESQHDTFDQSLGTVRYTAPEMLEGEGYNESVDVWAIGVVFFLLLTGKFVFDGSNRENIFRRIREKTIHYSKYHLERKEIKLLKLLLEKNPLKRIELEDILDDHFFH